MAEKLAEASKTSLMLKEAHDALKQQMKKVVDSNVELTQENMRLKEVCLHHSHNQPQKLLFCTLVAHWAHLFLQTQPYAQ